MLHLCSTWLWWPRLDADGGQLPQKLKGEFPLRLPAGFTASYSWSEDRRTLLAYVVLSAGPDLTGSAPEVALQNFPEEELRLRLFDLAAKDALLDRGFRQSATLKLPAGADFFLLVTAKDRLGPASRR
jgi:hypothetical protein